MACYRRGKAKPHEAGDHEAGDSSVPRRRPGAVSQKTDCKMQFWLVANDNTQPDGQWRVKWCENRASISHILLGRLTIELTSNIRGGKPYAQPLTTAASISGPQLGAPGTSIDIDADHSFRFPIPARQYSWAGSSMLYDSTNSQ
ncbi:hypothetical protein E4U49_003522 [Claviceps purpurea]|nr:hypothetical protein E4U49_003522 [Claviceps purpurea]